MRPLIIVESPAKAKTIEKFLGRRYSVKASKGHVRDLPKSQLGVSVEEGFAPRYITIRGKGEVIKELREAAKKSDKVFLATDPDREGEAISWHLAETLGLKEDQPVRIVFHEITEDAVKNALRHPRPIDRDLVDAQQARRILDRLVGYRLSPLLWRKVRPGLSAGRVQSAAVHLIVEREEEIRAFRTDRYFTVEADLQAKGGRFAARYQQDGEAGDRIADEAFAKDLERRAQQGPFRIQSVERKPRRRNAPPPFTTSTLQQEASRRLGFTVRRTMMIAQALYEGLEVAGRGHIGLVTYIRTDSTRIADTARAEAHAYVESAFGPEYAHPVERKERQRAGVQDAHEAIRPTDVHLQPDGLKGSLTREQLQLYRLIWQRFLASEMSPAEFEQTTVRLEAAGEPFRATGSIVTFRGYQAVLGKPEEEEPGEKGDRVEKGGELPALSEGEECQPVEVAAIEHFTEPPPRFTEATLVKALEERGIGRPSTYAPTIQTVQTRGYVERRERRLHPTELGEVVDQILREHFQEIVDPEFTAAMEQRLDRIEEGQAAWREVLREFYEPFESELKRAEAEIDRVTTPEEVSDVVCDVCGRQMVIKHGRFGKFLACPGYPECKNTKPLREPTGVTCPSCGGEVVERHTKRGRRFYGCSNYPKCTFTTWYKPVRTPCPRCGAFLVERPKRGADPELVCVREGCGYRKAAEEMA